MMPKISIEQFKYARTIFERAEAARVKSQIKYPQPNYVSLKLAEEAGEVVRAAVHYAEGRLPWEEVEGEAVQAIAMIMRLLIEGDQVNGIIPPTNQGPISDEFDYINRTYGTDFKRDQRVKVDGRAGTVTSANGAHIMVLFDGMPSPRPCHPTWEVTSGGDDK